MGEVREPGEGTEVRSTGAGREEPDKDQLSDQLRRQIREFAKLLPELNYYEVLGVPRDASAEAIRDGFFERSKRFHPDRHFRKDVGKYGPVLHEIFKRVAVAHDVLRDPETRTKYDASLERAERAAGRREEGEIAHAAGAPEAPAATPATEAERKPRRRPLSARARPAFALRALERYVALGREKAARLFAEAEAHKARADWARAASSLHMALAHDPRNPRYTAALEEVLPRANEQRVESLLGKVEALLGAGARAEAVELLGQAADLRPTDAELADRVARLLLDLHADPERARMFAQRAVDLDDTRAGFCKTLGRALRDAGQLDEARHQFERVVVLDPKDKEVKAELALL